MLYYAAIAAMGIACALAFRWPVVVVVASLVAVAAGIMRWRLGFPLATAALYGAMSALLLQIFYVLGGLLLSVRVRRVGAKKNLKV